MNARCLSVIRVAPVLARRQFLTQPQIPVEKVELNEPDVWENARPFDALPGPSKYALLKAFMPGGRYYKKSLSEINQIYRNDYGDIFLLPGLFGKRNLVFSFNPDDYQKIFRTEGVWPVRRGLDIVQYYRKVHRSEIFQHAAGLVAEQGENWAHFRKIVNPVMMNPKTTKFYVPKMDNVMKEFIERIKVIRDSKTFEVPANFEEDINNWAMDTVSLVALDTELGLINHSERNPQAKEVIESMKYTFALMYELDFQPSLWKIMPTPKYKKIIECLDKVTMLTIKNIDIALERVKNATGPEKPDSEKSVLERLLKIDRLVAITMAMDILLAGVDTTSSAVVACMVSLSKYPDKQELLRREILTILPDKDTPLTTENMKNMPYLRAFIKESQRLYPVSTGNFRSTGRDLVLSGYQVPKGTDVAMPSEMIMREEKYYSRATEFIPERWLRDGGNDQCPMSKNVNPFVFLPFGFGPRMCIGRRIVDLELETAVCRLVRNFHLQFDYPTENVFRSHIVNVPNVPLRFKFKDVEV